MTKPNEISALILVLTAQCNLRCSYCYENRKSSRRMLWKTLQEAIEFLLDSTLNEVSIVFYGGEPLLAFPMIRRAVEYAKKHRRTEQHIDFAVRTNGLLLDDEKIAYLMENNFEITLGFDGIERAQNERGEGSFHFLDDFLYRLRITYPIRFKEQIHVGITVIPRTIQYMAESFDYLLSKGIHKISLSPAFTDCSTHNGNLLHQLDAQFSRIYESSLNHYHSTGNVPLSLFRIGHPNPVREGESVALCGILGKNDFAVDVDGCFSACVTTLGSFQHYGSKAMKDCADALRIGTLQDSVFWSRFHGLEKRVIKMGIFLEKEKKYSSFARCGECDYITTCSVCPISIIHTPNNDDLNRIPDFQCAFNLVSRKYSHRFPSRPLWLDIVRSAKVQELISKT